MTTDPNIRDYKPVTFNGKAGEWFGIWIVNLLLSILTIGIYSAWAKVRQKKYFYGNTSIEGRTFDYHATGMQIFIGRLIVVGAFILLGVLSAVIPFILVLFYIALIVFMPYILIRSATFNARNSSWANVRFNFSASYGDAFVTYILLPVGVLLTFYTTFPFLTRRVNRFYIDGHSLGRSRFTLDAPGIGAFYKAAILPVLWFLGVAALFAFFIAVPLFSGPLDPSDPMLQFGPVIALYGLLFVGVLPAAIMYRALVRNIVYAHSELEGGHRFSSTTTPKDMLMIAITNALAVVCTLGLALPWAQIRMARYLADNTYVVPHGSLDAFVSTHQGDSGAVGDAYTDIEGIDLGGAAI